MNPELIKFDPDCVRKKSNWSKTAKDLKFDVAEPFNGQKMLEQIDERSPKLSALLKNIDALDKADMRKDGHLYKHFIFCDLKSSTYGAKLLAAALIAKGMVLGYSADKVGEPSEPSKQQTPSSIVRTEVKRTIKRRKDTPRPSSLVSESKAIPFVPISPILEESEAEAEAEEAEEEAESMNGGAKKKKIFKKMALLDQGSNSSTKNNMFYLLSSAAVYDQPISVQTKKEILRRFNERPDNVHGEHARIIVMDSGFKEGIDLFDIKYIHIFEPPVNSADQKQIIGRGTRLCGQKGLEFHPTKGWPLYVFIYDLSIPEPMRPGFLGATTAFELYLKSLYLDIRLFDFAADLEDTAIYGSADYELNRKIHEFSTGSMEGGAKKRIVINRELPPLVLDTQGDSLAFVSGQGIQVSLPSGKLVEAPTFGPLSFREMRGYIAENFGDYAWSDIKMENGCLTKGGKTSHRENKVSLGLTKGGDSCLKNFAGGASLNGGAKKTVGGTIVNLTPTQDFVSHYFTPQAPVKGLLLWHSVGTGKTCSAIATATASFEPQGYTILWITRTTLKNDIWKNMFDQVCSAMIRDRIEQEGLVLPAEQNKRMRLLSKAWKIRPMSYKQFSNLVSKENNFYKTLVKINGQLDPLRKTLLVIDEAHKLYGGGDLSSLERPDMGALHEALMHSYQVSGQDSVRLLLMTATPITENPMELVKLMNLCSPRERQMPDQFAAFSQEFLELESGRFSERGRSQFLDLIAGQISYLNRERDARQFSQPIIERIPVPLIKDVSEAETLDKRYVRSMYTRETDALKQKIAKENEQISGDLKDLDSTRFYALRDKCDDYEGPVKKGCIKVANATIKALINEAKESTKAIRETIKTIREEIKNKNIFKQTALEGIQERVSMSPEDLVKFKDGMFYTLKYKCGKKVSASASAADQEEWSKDDPAVARINEEIAAYNTRIEGLESMLKSNVLDHQARIKRIKQLMRDPGTNELEKSVLKLTIKDIRKTFRKTSTASKKQAALDKRSLTKTRKALEKDRKKQITRVKKTLKSRAKDAAKLAKAEAKAEKKLRRTMRKQGELREEFQDGVLKDLMAKYSTKMDEDFAGKRAAIEGEVKAKAEAKEAKAKAKAEAKAKVKEVKDREREARKTQKLREKTEKAEAKKQEKQKEKEQKTKEKQKEKEEKEKAKQREREEKKREKELNKTKKAR
jgi:hypothetical protein